MFLTGTFGRNLDEKLRIAIPKPLKDALGEQLESPMFCAPGTDGSLALYPERAFSQLAEKLADHSPTAKQVRDYARLFFARAVSVKMDGHGRIRIPPDLASLAGLTDEIVLIGVRDHMELWSKSGWEQFIEERQVQYDQIAEEAFS